MSSAIQSVVDSCNSVLNNAGSFTTSFLAINYFVGEKFYLSLRWLFTSLHSLIWTLLAGLRIMLEDLVVFIKDITEAVYLAWYFFTRAIDVCVTGVCNSVDAVVNFVSRTVDGVVNSGVQIYLIVQYCTNNIGVFFNLLGSSFILLLNLIPRTLLLLSAAGKALVYNSISWMHNFLLLTVLKAEETVHWLYNAPVELYVGIVVGSLSLAVGIKVIVSKIQEHNITVEVCARNFLHLLCSVYVLIIRTIARIIGLIFTVIEVTVSNLRVPMMSSAGDSEDEGEDREHLVGELEESDDEDRAREARKRRNYDLLLQRRTTRGVDGSYEDDLLREVEREREDKLCVICVDKEKCIMILPCRHLCICEGCQAPLRTHRNSCPICRKEIKQMIKAYL